MGSDTDIKALLMGQGIDGLAEELAKGGAAEAIYAEGAAVENYTSDAHRRAIEAIIGGSPGGAIDQPHTQRMGPGASSGRRPRRPTRDRLFQCHLRELVRCASSARPSTASSSTKSKSMPRRKWQP